MDPLQQLGGQLAAALVLANQIAGTGTAAQKVEMAGAASNIKIAQQWVKQAQGG